jgi:predicted RNase H-like HicB family nuclease
MKCLPSTFLGMRRRAALASRQRFHSWLTGTVKRALYSQSCNNFAIRWHNAGGTANGRSLSLPPRTVPRRGIFHARGESYNDLIFGIRGLSLLPVQPFQRMPMAKVTQLRIELEQEEDGRWIGEVPTLPGVMAYGQTKAAALAAVQALALRTMADRLEHDEAVPEELLNVSFIAA